jgi:hypothetical protein
MVKRGGKEVVTVEIFKDTYEVMKANAERERWKTKDYINIVLIEAMERDRLLRSYAPSLSKINYKDKSCLSGMPRKAKQPRFTCAIALYTAIFATPGTASIYIMLWHCQRQRSCTFANPPRDEASLCPIKSITFNC